jgi:hypothetical protein
MDPKKRDPEQELEMKNAIIEGYLETGVPLAAAQIAERLKWSKSKVYKVLSNTYGAPEGIDCIEDREASYSTNYRGQQSGSHKVWKYAPSLSTLRQVILDARKAASPGSS